jgi:flagellar biosynthesis chaperone FliJ
MKRFQFPLDRVRLWRAEQASAAELKLRQLRDRLAGLGAQRRQVALDRASSEQDVLGQSSIAASEVQNLEAYRRYAANQIRAIELREQQCEEQIREQRQKVMEARQKAELLERLKQKAWDRWRAASERAEESLAAELYLAKRARR